MNEISGDPEMAIAHIAFERGVIKSRLAFLKDEKHMTQLGLLP